MTSKLANLLGWPQIDIFPSDRYESQTLLDPNGTYAMFIPEGLTSFSVPSATNTELLRESDRRRNALLLQS